MNAYEILESDQSADVVAEIRRMDKSGEGVWQFNGHTGDQAFVVVDGGETLVVIVAEGAYSEISDLLADRIGA
ncbi:hypothetical protein SEA_BOLT007_75 [Arthrobacter phage Bolt007]|uniref:Uncharacterized protein n=1 Tax=Arthrobacter phage Bolt007 TaxID=3017297 RepID=A0AA49E5I2_9CAUD|nr:hypothetical protein SEA_BOLT007_75 [Arthrobacter phage Bolt007]